ncbi:MAG: Lcl C-terminal domain-containing protein [Candidatus Anammoxibacter sp.]
MHNTYISTLLAVILTIFLSSISLADTVTASKTDQISLDCSFVKQNDIKEIGNLPGVRYIDNGDGTVTDNSNNLMWLKDGGCFGLMKWDKSSEMINRLNSSPENFDCQDYKAQYTDWRLPSIKEFEELLNIDEPKVFEWLNNNGFSNIQPQWYWSSTPCGCSAGSAWYVSLWKGKVYTSISPYNFDLYVWPVRLKE